MFTLHGIYQHYKHQLIYVPIDTDDIVQNLGIFNSNEA